MNRFVATSHAQPPVRTPDPDELLLALLLRAAGDPVSGTALGTALGISRVAVWGRIERLRGEGVPVEPVARRGYRLAGEPQALHPSFLRARLAVDGADCRVLVLPEIDSTNSEAERQLADGRATPFFVLAGLQTAGRGRFGRAWHSPDEGNLYLSAAFRPTLPPDRMAGLTVWLGLRVAAALGEATGVDVRLKWPNDLIVDGRKLGGMLAEARIDADRMRDLVFGIGINVNADPSRWPADLARIATSLRGARGSPVPLHVVASRVVLAVGAAVAAYERGGIEAERDALFARHDCLRGREVVIQAPEGPRRVEPVGLAADGGLRVRLPDGTERTVNAGEVTIGSGTLVRG